MNHHPGRATVIVLLIVAALLSAQTGRKERILVQVVREGLSAWHVQPRTLDDRFSRLSFSLFQKQLDASKSFLLLADVTGLQVFETRLDEDLEKGSLELARRGSEVLKKRIEQVREYCHEILAVPFDFSVNETIELDAEKRAFSRTSQELKEWWRKQLKYFALVRYMDALRSREKNKPKIAEPAPSPAQLELNARKDLAKGMDRYFKRVLQEREEDRQARLLNAMIASFDPHSRYFPPREKEDFDIDMSGTLEGIGVLLSEDDSYIKVVDVLPGGPAWIEGRVQVEDVVIKVAQEDDEAVDVIGMPVSDVARLVRGKKGTRVRLTIRKPDGRIQEVLLIRNIVEIQETYARSAVLVDEAKKSKVGYIYLPRFYHDFNHENGRNSADDVRQELISLKRQGVQGIILDLRSNGGGALEDSVKMAGLFIRKGPVVQVKDRRGKPSVHSDDDPEVVCEEPLIVLVNALSASASEIVAAAIQDYGRGVIMGSAHTFGKGTVQMMVDLDRIVNGDISDISPLGAITLTIQKFYRVSGPSTQYRGVIPDIVFPESTSYLKIGERYLENSLPWDAVEPVSFQKWNPLLKLADIQNRSRTRIEGSERLKRIVRIFDFMKNRRDQNRISLSLAEYRREQEELWRKADEIDLLHTVIPAFAVVDTEGHPVVLDKTAKETQENRHRQWLIDLNTDEMIGEAVQVLRDMVRSVPVQGKSTAS